MIPPGAQPAAALGDIVTVTGSHLLNATGVVLNNSLRGIQQTLPLLSPATNNSLQFQPPNLNAPGELAAGIYDLSVQVPIATGPTTTNSLPFAISAQHRHLGAGGPIASGNTTLTVPCSPFLRPGQEVFLIIGDQLVGGRRVHDVDEFTVVHLPQSATDWRPGASADSRRRHREPHRGPHHDAAVVHGPAGTGGVMDNAVANTTSWPEQNQAYLSAEFARLRQLFSDREQSEAKAAELEKHAAELRSQMQPPPAIDLLSELFALTGFERQLLLLCAGVEMDSRLAEACARGAGQSAEGVRHLRRSRWRCCPTRTGMR